MAEQGMFGNQYQQAVADEALERRQLNNTQGLTGWAAITQAMGQVGGELGYQGGQAMGGQTAAQKQSSDFDAVMASVPDFDPTNPESMRQMSSALYAGNFYDESMQLLTQSNVFERNLAEVKQIEAQTNSLVAGDNLAEMKFNLSKRFNESQMGQIDATIASINSGVTRDDALAELKKTFTEADIKRIEQVINASVSGEARADKQLILSGDLNKANILKINQQIKNLVTQEEVDEQTILNGQQNVLQSKAMIEDLGSSDMSKAFEYAKENGGYEGTFMEYQTFVGNLKTVAKEGSINLYDYARTVAGGSYTGTLEQFITSVTGVDYKRAVASAAAAETSYSPPGKTELSRITEFVDKDIDFGISDFDGKDGEEGDYTENDIAVQLYYLAKNRGVTPDTIWNEFKSLDSPLASLMATAVNTASGGQAGGQGTSSSALTQK